MNSWQIVYQDSRLTAVSLFYDGKLIDTYAFAGGLSDKQIKACVQSIFRMRPKIKTDGNVIEFPKNEMHDLG